METFADLAEAVCAAMFAHYEAKWDLFLRGLAPLQQSLALAPAGAAAALVPPEERAMPAASGTGTALAPAGAGPASIEASVTPSEPAA
jgi:hypothetical protein